MLGVNEFWMDDCQLAIVLEEENAICNYIVKALVLWIVYIFAFDCQNAEILFIERRLMIIFSNACYNSVLRVYFVSCWDNSSFPIAPHTYKIDAEKIYTDLHKLN